MEKCICLFCLSEFSKRKDSNVNKFCSKSCNAKFYHAQRKALTKYESHFCKFCNKEIRSYQIFCDRSCAASHNNKIRKEKGFTTKGRTKSVACIECGVNYTISLTASNNYKCNNCKDKFITKQCKNCNLVFKISPISRQNTCSKQCCTALRRIGAIKGGKISAQKNNRRSKNEILFANMCAELGDILTNIPLFKGWDADVILPKYKIAVLWNGVWHHKKITSKHSVKQVQNRDKIKIKEIISAGYTPYIINDMGSENSEFVVEQFNIFKSWVQERDSNLAHDLVMSQVT